MSEKCMFCGKPYQINSQELFGKVISLPVPACDCEEHELEKQRAAEAKAARLRNVAALNLPPIFAPYWLKNLECEHRTDAQIFVEGFRTRKSKGLFLVGPNGNGKSTLAAVICKELAYRGYLVLFTTMTEMLDRMELGAGFNRAQQAQKLLKTLTAYDFVVFDDYGRENYTPVRLQNVFQIVDKLYTHQIPFCITTNQECFNRVAKIPELEAINDRISQALTKWDFERPSFRREKK